MKGKTRQAQRHPVVALLLAALLGLAAMQASAQTTPATDQQIKEKAQQDAQEIARHLMQVQQSDATLSCDKAVENARYGVETMLEVGQRNVDGGHLPKAQFDAVAKPLQELLPQLTPADCAASDGNKREFYRCMSSDYNHVMACAQAHRF